VWVLVGRTGNRLSVNQRLHGSACETKVPSAENEKRVILHWLALREQDGQEAEPPQWLDCEQQGDIDALAPPFAIEHTSVDALPDQRQYEAQFRAVLNGLSDVTVTTFRLRIAIAQENFRTVNHQRLGECLSRWVRDQAPNLPEGLSSGKQLCGLAVGWYCFKYSDRPPGLRISLAVDTDSASGTNVSEVLRRKAAKLHAYKLQGYATVLIVESSDLALMAAPTFLELCLNSLAANDLDAVDELWFADTSLGDVELWKVALSEEELDGPFYPRLRPAV